MAFNKRKTRMYEPWGYVDENNYQSSEIIHDNDLDSFFSGVEYKEDENKIYFTNKDGNQVGSLNVSDFVKPGQIIEKTWCKDGIIYIKFTNGDIVTINIKELIDEYDFEDGLQVNDGVVSVLVDGSSERWLTVSPNGIKISGLQNEIDELDNKILNETNRATSAETELQSEIEKEKLRAISAETALDERIDEIISGTPIQELDELIEKLGYKDNDTLLLNNEHEVAFGEYNVSNTSTEPSGQTVFSIGIGTDENDRKNAIEVRKDGSVYMWIEGDFMNVNLLLGQIAHEVYD